MRKIAMLFTTALVVVAGTTVAMTENGFGQNIREFLSGSEEVPVVLTAGQGVFTATINDEDTEIAYKLNYSGIEADVTQSHIHIGQANVNGGISVWLCSNLASPPTPAGVQACPVREGEIEGVITSADVTGPLGQGVAPGNFARLLEAIRAGNTYVNIHSTRSTGGEIRSQIDHDLGHR